jgi:hypothetical protein
MDLSAWYEVTVVVDERDVRRRSLLGPR